MQSSGPIAEALRRGATVVTATSRAARSLHLEYAELQRTAGHKVWPTPAIVDWDSFLRELWREHSFAHPEAPLLLSPLQEEALWRRCLAEDAGGLVAPEALASLALKGWSLLSQYRAHPARRQPWYQTDAEHFRSWAALFERECARHQWLSASQLEERLAAVPDLPLPAEIWLAGFDEPRITPAQRLLIGALQDRGVAVHGYLPPAQHAERLWICADDARQELAACAAWCRGLLDENPAARIGILVPAAGDIRGEMERVFRRVLMPASEDIRQPAPPMPFEFSLGQPLAEVPAIRAALLLLRWIARPLREASISWLVLSGFVADTAANPLSAAQHDAKQRSAGPLAPQRTLESYRLSLAGTPGLRSLDQHLGALLKAVEANRVLDRERPASAWSELVQLLLERAAWPGTRPADTVQYQAQQRFERLLDELAQLDFDGSLFGFTAFLEALERHAAETVFAPESHDAPIQIMSPAESAGRVFDAVWFMGTDDTRWPGRGRLHPLLPPSLQRETRMPHATPDEDSRLARAITARLLAGTPRIVLSYAQRERDAELRPSPLISALFPSDTAPQRASELLASREPPAAPVLETVVDDSGVLPWPVERTAGGSEVLRSQAACPFQSFALRRLSADSLEENEWGLSASERGKILHRVMERLFSGTESTPAPLRTRDEIVSAIETNTLGAILEKHIEAAVLEFASDTPSDAWTESYLGAEKRRLRARIAEWLACEAKRHPFTVERCEQRLSDVHIGDLRLNLRADRIDLLPDGTRFILDYKTGEVSPSAWQGERPEEPQLPLYAAFGNVEDVSGLLFAQIRAGKTGFQGRVRNANEQLMPGLKSNLALVRESYSDFLRENWARVLQDLAAEFLQGEAAVAPRDSKVCSQCGLHGLCRIAEAGSRVAGTEEDADV